MSDLQRPYRAPASTAMLGHVLDLQFELEGLRTVVTQWAGWAMLADPDAMERSPGRARLYLVPFRPEGTHTVLAGAAAEETYQRWHSRNPKRRLVLDVPDAIGCFQGRVLRIGYRSDKWSRRGRVHDYDHDFREGGALAPLLYTDSRALERARGAVIVGGDMRVTPRGID